MRKRLDILFFSLGWAILALTITYVRFGSIPGEPFEILGAILGFSLLGAISGRVHHSLMRRSSYRWVKVGVNAGYIAAIPFAYLLGIVGPLTLEIVPILEIPKAITYLLLFPFAIGFWGAIPLVLGMLIGYGAGRLVQRFA